MVAPVLLDSSKWPETKSAWTCVSSIPFMFIPPFWASCNNILIHNYLWITGFDSLWYKHQHPSLDQSQMRIVCEILDTMPELSIQGRRSLLQGLWVFWAHHVIHSKMYQCIHTIWIFYNTSYILSSICIQTDRLIENPDKSYIELPTSYHPHNI